ncbi:hypothetical protein NUW58_g6289 [Xylaria curta]|uniref:Uncharacterized protein n=1 Tax=Xylaria curta TaxID=42375 RepID=A0ACC1NV79_9PEZI|nr:hypothetical protein NUW58_g6289 [Xylaria curta]
MAEDLSPGIIALAWILTTASTVVVGLRLWVRLYVRQKRGLNLDDFIVLITYALGIVNSIMVTIAAHWGLGKHQNTLVDMPQSIVYSIKWAFLAEGPAILASGFARISFAILLLSITPPARGKRTFLWSIIALQFIADIAAVIVTYAQCQPLEAYWDPRVPGNCWMPTIQQYTGFTQGSICSAVDVILAIYPASLFWNLNMKWEQKWGHDSASVSSIAKTINLKAFTETQDFTFALAQTALWWTTEVNLVLIAVSIPTLSPIIKPLKTMSANGSGPSADVVMNTFHSRKLKKAEGTANSEGDFELLRESDGYPYINTDDCPPVQRTYDYKISPEPGAQQGEGTHGIRRELTVSITRGDSEKRER